MIDAGDGIMIKLVLCDIDGTLIDSSEILSNKALVLAQKLHKKGIYFSLATGRVESMAEPYVRQLGIEIPYIACNGVTIARGNEIIQRNQIPLSELKELVYEADRLGMSVIYSIEGKETVFRVTPWILSQRKKFDRYHKEHRFTEKEWNTLFVDKLSIMDDKLDGRISIIEDICRKLPPEYGFTRYVDRSVEVVNGKASKGNAVHILADYLGVDLKEILAIGDHQNDIEMLSEAGIGVAVANATHEVKQAADYVCKKSYIDGVIEAVEAFC